MNVFEKLNEVRCAFQNANVKKSGNNRFAGYTYFELADILPVINRLCRDVKAIPIVSFTQDMATLEFINAEKTEEKIVFTSPMSTASLKGCHDVQNLGAVQTYIKRYLYQHAFEIAECDELDATTGQIEPARQTAPARQAAPARQIVPWNRAQLKKIGDILNTKDANGKPLFDEEEKKQFREKTNDASNFDGVLKVVQQALLLKQPQA